MADIGKLLIKIGVDLDDLKKGVGKAQDTVSGFLGKVGSMAPGLGTVFTAAAAVAVTAIAGIGTAIGSLVKVGFDAATSLDKSIGGLATGLGISKQEAEKFEGVMKNIYANNFGKNFDDIGGAVAEINKQLGSMPDAELQNIAEKAFALRDAFGAEVPESINAVKVLMEEMGLSSSEALDFITSGFQKGLNSSGDFLDTITEYGNLFGEAQVPAGAFFSILESGLQGGVLGTDKVADLFKEFSIRIKDGSDTTKDALETIGLNYDTLIGQMASGSITGFEAFQMIQDKIAGLSDPILANQVGVGLMGTQFEDLGASAVLAIDDATTSMSDMAGASDTLNEQYNNLGDVWEGLKRKAEVALIPIGQMLLESLNSVMPQIEEFFGWFETTALPWIEEFIQKATPILTNFFGKFEENFGPGVERLGEAIQGVAEALGLTEPGVDGMEGALQALSSILEGVVRLWDLATIAIKAYLFVIEPTLQGLRAIFDIVSKIISIGGSIGEALFNNARYNVRGFAEGGSFVVPPGYPNDSFLMGVTSGEFVSVTPAGGGDTYDQRQVNMTINSRASTENLYHSYQQAAALIP